MSDCARIFAQSRRNALSRLKLLKQPLFSTIGPHPRNSFPIWCDVLCQQALPIEAEQLENTPFEGRIDIADIGPILLTRIAQGGVCSEVTPELLRRLKKDDTLVVLFKRAGTSTVRQEERVTEHCAGDLVVIDHRPAILTSGSGSQSLFLELPRERLESLPGPARLYSALTIDGEIGATALVTTLFHDPIARRFRERYGMTPRAARSAAIGAISSTDATEALAGRRLEAAAARRHTIRAG